MKRTISTGFIFVLLMAAGSVLSAADSNWIVRGQYVKTWPSTDSYQTESVIGDLPPIFSSFSVDSGQGFGLDIEYKFNKRIGIVLSAIFTDFSPPPVIDSIVAFFVATDPIAPTTVSSSTSTSV